MACLLLTPFWATVALGNIVDMPPNIPTYANPSASGVNCWQCHHFGTSWDPALPYSCKLLGFKSRNLPCLQVLQLDGRPCQGFEPKRAKPAVASTKLSANRQ
jgi:hypothetical protein